MQPVRLYLIPWSHFCDKVRWALDLKGMPYEKVTYNTTGKTSGLERAPKSMIKLTPIIEDPNNSNSEKPIFMSDSTPILRYLDENYSNSSPLFPTSDKQAVIDLCLRLDSTLGPYVRRLAYVQIIGEYPRILCLMQSVKYPWANNPNDIRSRIIARFVACFVIARFRLHRIREDQVVESTEQVLLDMSARLQNSNYLVGNSFTAADITFCSLFKPLEILPYFKDDKRFQSLFDYHDRIRKQHDFRYSENINLMEKFIRENRERLENPTACMKFTAFLNKINVVKHFCSWMMTGIVSKVYGPTSDEDQPQEFSSDGKSAANDQRNLNINSKWKIVPFIIKYTCHRLFTIPGQYDYLNRR